MKKNLKKGFSLIELIVVMAIMAILVLMASPWFSNYLNEAKIRHIGADIKIVENKSAEYTLLHDGLIPTDSTDISVADLQTAITELKLYNKKGLMTEIDDTEVYHILPKPYVVSQTGSKLKGSFIVSSGGFVYYLDTKPGRSGMIDESNNEGGDLPPNGAIVAPVAKIDLTPELSLTTTTFITWNYTNSTPSDGATIVDAEWINMRSVYSTPGSYTVSLRVLDSKGVWSNWISKQITVAVASFPTSFITESKAGFTGNNYDEFKDGAATPDGGYITIGMTSSTDGDAAGLTQNALGDALIVKYNSLGELQWKKVFGGSSSDEFTSIVNTSDGGYLAAGFSNSTDGDMAGQNKGSYDGFIVKISSSGSTQWVKDIGGSGKDEIKDLIHTSDGGYLIAGTFTVNDGMFSGLGDPNINYGGGFVCKLDSYGNVQWVDTLVGNNTEYIFAACETTSGDYVVTGWGSSQTGDYADLNIALNRHQVVIFKYDNNGNMVMSRTITSASVSEASEITATSDGGYAIVGRVLGNTNLDQFSHDSNGSQDAFIVKMTPDDQIEWVETVGGSGQETFTHVIQTEDGGYLVTGNTNSTSISGNIRTGKSDGLVVKFTNTGSVSWMDLYSAASNLYTFLNGVVQTSDNEYMTFGYVSTTPHDAIIVKYTEQ